MQHELKHKTISAVLWNFFEKFGQQLLYLISGVVVARLVTPEEFGLVGLLGLFIAIPNILTESGFSSALIRERDADEKIYSTIFFFNILIASVLYIFLYFLAPSIASFYDQPRLVVVARVQFLSILFYALGVIQYIKLTKDLAFKTLSKINLTALFLSSVCAIVMAIFDMGVWAIVAQQVLMAFIRMVGLWIYGMWRAHLHFQLHILKRYWSYSSKLLLVSLLNAFGNNLYSLLIGRVYTTADVGYYNQANKYQEIPSGIITNSFRAILFPIISKVQDDQERALRVLRRIIAMVSFLIFPSMFLLAVIGRPFILFLLSDIWLPSVPIFTVLCFAGSLIPFTVLLGDSFATMGRSDLTLVYEIFRKIFLLAGVAILFHYGVMILAYWWIAYMLFSLAVALFFIPRVFPYGFRYFIQDIRLHVVCAASWAFVASLTTPLYHHNLVQMICQGIIVGVGYLLTLRFFKDPTLMEIIDQITTKYNSLRQKS